MTDSDMSQPQSDTKPDYSQHALDWESSQINQKMYCEKHNICYRTFVIARSKLLLSRGTSRKQKSQNKFIPVRVQPTLTEQNKQFHACIKVSLTNGHQLDISDDLRAEQLSCILKLIGAA